MDIMQILTEAGIPAAYGFFETPQKPPYAIYLGSGQEHLSADSTYYKVRNIYRIEYYYKTKSAQNEENLERVILERGYNYDKSEDVYIDSEKIYVIYYTVWKK